MPVDDAAPPDPPRQPLHPDVLRLGLVSFLTDLSSEMIFSVFAVVFTTVAGASTALLGLIEGLADFSAASLNYLAGWLSDRSGRRKWLATAGYAFSTLAKLILLVSSSVAALALFRVIERLGKGFRGPPRDAWLSTIAASSTRGYAFGVHKALDKAGAVAGPLVAYGLLRVLGDSPGTYAILFLVAFVPAALGVLVLARLPDQPGPVRPHESLRQNWQQLSPGFKRFLLPSGLFALGYLSLGFVLLKAHAVGFSVSEVVLLYALFNTTCVVCAPVVGWLGDRVGRSRIVLSGYAVFAGINLPASLVAGLLWVVSPSLAFGLAAAMAVGAIVVFLAVKPA
ncbi:MAG: MFS transporter [Burkholderiales bacterium PBB5]|nr:MAG: MFS transporter [Burkholderiales bacterium PBB5]